MRKKIVLASSLLMATLAQAEIEQSGFFVGIDFSQTNSELLYDNSGNMATSPYTNKLNSVPISYKIGYKTYVTRVYARYSELGYKDEKRNKFSIDNGQVYELNADYTPMFYISKTKNWNIKGVIGVGVGYNSSTMTDLDGDFLLPVGETAGARQNYMEYGGQLGVMSETSIGLSVEAAYRVRYGNLQEFTDTANNATFSLETHEFYLGLNYLF